VPIIARGGAPNSAVVVAEQAQTPETEATKNVETEETKET
jgi:hypothetical protein